MDGLHNVQEAPSVEERVATDYNLPPLLRMISTGSFSFIARGSPDTRLHLGNSNEPDLERDSVLAHTVHSMTPMQGLAEKDFNVSGPVDVSKLFDSSQNMPMQDSLQSTETCSGLISTPRSILTKGRSPGTPSSPHKIQVSFDPNKLKNGLSEDHAQLPASVPNIKEARKRFYSQPLQAVLKHAGPVNAEGDRPLRSHSMDGSKYGIFRTRSSKHDRPISRMQSKHGIEPLVDMQSRNENEEGMAVPAGRYFDALKGPELEILKDSEELVLPLDERWPFLLRFPIGCFGACLGLGSQAILWKALATSSSMSFLQIPLIVNTVLWCIALLSLIFVFTIYAFKCILYFEAVRREYYHPVRVNFFFAPWIACMFLVLGVPPCFAKSISPAIWCILMAPIFMLELKIYGQWLSGGERNLSKVANPSTHLSLVGNFVGALLAARVGWKEPAVFFWAVGFGHYLVLLVTLYQRLPTAEALPKELHPVFFLFVAAPSIASVAWKFIMGQFDHVSRICYFMAIFLYSSLAVRINFFRGFQFSIAWWAYTFPMTASAVATIHYSMEVKHPITQVLAIILSLISATTVLLLFVSTIWHGLIWGSLFPNDIAIAIKGGQRRRKHRRAKTPSSNGSYNCEGEGQVMDLEEGGVNKLFAEGARRSFPAYSQAPSASVVPDPLPLRRAADETPS